MRRLQVLFGLAGLALAGCASVPAGPDPAMTSAALDPAQQRGHDFAVRRCSGCHAVGLDDGGAGEGPRFQSLARRYNALALERRFAEVSAHGFDRMPPVEFTHAEAEDLAAYLSTLQAN